MVRFRISSSRSVSCESILQLSSRKVLFSDWTVVITDGMGNVSMDFDVSSSLGIEVTSSAILIRLVYICSEKLARKSVSNVDNSKMIKLDYFKLGKLSLNIDFFVLLFFKT